MYQTMLEEFETYIGQGGLIMWPLVAGTFALWYALGYRVYILRRGNPRSVRVLLEKYLDGYPRQPVGIVDTAVVAGIQIARRNPDNMRKCLDDHFATFLTEMDKYAALARTIVLVAPLAGLLGTVIGMIEMFDSLAEQTFYSQSGGIARGIAQALFTTQLGLAIAVPGLIVGRMLERRQVRIQMELDQAKDLLCTERVRLSG